MTQHNKPIVMEPVMDLANFGIGANAKTVNTTKPEAMVYMAKKITYNI
jgi:hypothetical protein